MDERVIDTTEAASARQQAQPPLERPADPDNPRWGPGLALGAWGFSIVVTLIVQLIAVAAWMVYRARQGEPMPLKREEFEALLTSASGLLVQLLSTFPAHLLTLAFCWAVVTGIGRRPFLGSLGWRWTASRSLLGMAPLITAALVILIALGVSIGLGDSIGGVVGESTGRMGAIIAKSLTGAIVVAGSAVLLWPLGRFQRRHDRKAVVVLAKVSLVVGALAGLMLVLVGLDGLLPEQKETAFDQLLKASQEARIAIACLAVLTAPIVEEVVYRGVLYSSLRPRVGLWPAIGIVTALFAVVHFHQYWGNWSALLGLAAVSLTLTGVRAYTGSLAPCVAIHFLFNVVNSIQILQRGGAS
jgi:membrane protease YdiL (CAAX protease family)